MTHLGYAVMACILAVQVFYLSRSYLRGLAIAALFLVSLSHHLMLQTPGNLPNLPIQRLIVTIVMVFWLMSKKPQRKWGEIPFLSLFLLFALTDLISLMMCLDFTLGIKEYLSFTAEVLLFYIVMISSITHRVDALRVLHYVWVGLLGVSVIAFIERQTGFNVMLWLVPDCKNMFPRDVISTYPHRILMGTAMSMGWPLALVLMDSGRKGRWKYALSVPFFLAACYFSNSRGPWAGSILAGGLLLVLGSWRIRKRLLLIAALGLMTLLVRPGVWGTLVSRIQATMDESSFKGATYRYRWELWRVAYSQIRVSPVRFLWGYGPGSSAKLTITRVAERGKEHEIWSWDNHYAWFLVEIGVLGLGVLLLLYAAVVWKLLRMWRRSDLYHRNLIAGIIASLMVLLFMMTNVLIFAQQLFYLFWILVSAGIVIGESAAARVAQPQAQRALQVAPRMRPAVGFPQLRGSREVR